MAGTEYFSETAQPRDHIAVNTMRKSYNHTLSRVVSKMVILAQSTNFQNCIKKTNKIPEYARDFKKEYLLIIGINKMCFNFISKYETDNEKLFYPEYYDSIKYFIKRFLKGQERGKLQDISSLILRKYDFSFIEDLYLILIYENDFEDIDNLHYRDFYELFFKFYDKIKIEYYNDDIDDLISSEDSEDSEDSDTE